MIQIYLDEVLGLSARISFTIVEAPQAQAVEATVSQRDRWKRDLGVMALTFIIDEKYSSNHSVNASTKLICDLITAFKAHSIQKTSLNINSFKMVNLLACGIDNIAWFYLRCTLPSLMVSRSRCQNYSDNTRLDR